MFSLPLLPSAPVSFPKSFGIRAYRKTPGGSFLFASVFFYLLLSCILVFLPHFLPALCFPLHGRGRARYVTHTTLPESVFAQRQKGAMAQESKHLQVTLESQGESVNLAEE